MLIMEITVNHTKFSTIANSPDFMSLVSEYEIESANDEIGPVSPQIQTYLSMEDAGVLHAFEAKNNDQMIGFYLLLTPVLPHFGKKVGVTESYFVSAKYRKTGAGIRLLKIAEQFAKNDGCEGILVSAPVGGQLEKVMCKSKYRDVSHVFFKALK